MTNLAHSLVLRRRGGVASLFTMVGAAALAVGLSGCGPTFDPASLVTTTRVLGAKVTVTGDETRAAPRAGESATVSWLIEAPEQMPPLAWEFALCAPGSALRCGQVPVALYPGTDNPPRMTITLPADPGGAGPSSYLLNGRVCSTSAPTFDPQSELWVCADGGAGTTATLTIPVGGADTTADNHNPVADHGLTFDGAPWPVAQAGDDPCAGGLMISAGTNDHVIGIATAGDDRETFTELLGDPPVPTATRESLQISPFTTRGKLKNAFMFIEGTDPSPTPVAEAKWDAPEAKDVAAATPVAFTFVAHDGRGGADWTTRAACVVP